MTQDIYEKLDRNLYLLGEGKEKELSKLLAEIPLTAAQLNIPDIVNNSEFTTQIVNNTTIVAGVDFVFVILALTTISSPAFAVFCFQYEPLSRIHIASKLYYTVGKYFAGMYSDGHTISAKRSYHPGGIPAEEYMIFNKSLFFETYFINDFRLCSYEI